LLSLVDREHHKLKERSGQATSGGDNIKLGIDEIHDRYKRVRHRTLITLAYD
jgi:hypothetical protein